MKKIILLLFFLQTASAMQKSPSRFHEFGAHPNDDEEAALLEHKHPINQPYLYNKYEECTCKRCTYYCLGCAGIICALTTTLVGGFYLGNHGCSASGFIHPSPHPTMIGSGSTLRAMVMRK